MNRNDSVVVDAVFILVFHVLPLFGLYKYFSNRDRVALKLADLFGYEENKRRYNSETWKFLPLPVSIFITIVSLLVLIDSKPFGSGWGMFRIVMIVMANVLVWRSAIQRLRGRSYISDNPVAASLPLYWVIGVIFVALYGVIVVSTIYDYFFLPPMDFSSIK